MNYLDPETWKHPEINEICRTVISEGFGAPFNGAFQIPTRQRAAVSTLNRLYRSPDYWVKHFNWYYDLEYPASVEIGADCDGRVFMNFLQGTNKELRQTMISRFFFPLNQEDDKISFTNMDFDFSLLARGLYWMGVPNEILYNFNGTTYHNIIEWTLARRESWDKYWDLRPDSVE